MPNEHGWFEHFLALDEKLLLIDTSSGKIHKESPSKFDFSQRSVECFRVVDGIAILTTDALNNTTLAHFLIPIFRK